MKKKKFHRSLLRISILTLILEANETIWSAQVLASRKMCLKWSELFCSHRLLITLMMGALRSVNMIRFMQKGHNTDIVAFHRNIII